MRLVNNCGHSGCPGDQPFLLLSLTHMQKKEGEQGTLSACLCVLMNFGAGLALSTCPGVMASRWRSYLPGVIFMYLPTDQKMVHLEAVLSAEASASPAPTPPSVWGLFFKGVSSSCQDSHVLRFMKLTSVLTWPCFLKIPGSGCSIWLSDTKCQPARCLSGLYGCH